MEEEKQNVDGLTPRGHIRSGWGIMIIIIVVIIIGGGIGIWYYLTAIKGIDAIKISKNSTSSSPSASTAESPQAAKTKTYTSTSNCIQKFSFEYPNDWTLVKDFDFPGEENGTEGGACPLDLKFTKEMEKNTFGVLNVEIKALSNNVTQVILDDGVSAYNGNTTFAELTKTPPATAENITLGGVETKKYNLPGMTDWDYIGLLKNNTYFQIQLWDPDNLYKNDRGSKAGFETIINTWKFL